MDDKKFDKCVEKFNEDCEATERILEYSLFLPKIEPIKSGLEENWISEAVMQCYQNCHKYLFTNERYQFFGYPHAVKVDGTKTLLDILGDDDFKTMNGFKSLKCNFFATTVLSHCIMASYDTTLRFLLNDSITTYDLYKIKNHGLHKMIQENVLDESTLRILILKNSEEDTSKEATKLTSKLNTHGALYDIEAFTKFLEVDRENSMTLYSADMLYSLFEVNASTFQCYLKTFCEVGNKDNNKNIYDAWDYFNTVYKKLYIELPSQEIFGNNTDRLYYFYKLENILGLELVKEILQNIDKLKRGNRPFPEGKSNFETLAEISRFPNVFSRNLYIKYAFAYVQENSTVHVSSFLNPGAANEVSSINLPSTFNFNEWMLVFEKFCKYFNKLIFPVEEWYFFLILKKTVDKHVDAQPKEKVSKLKDVLSKYIESNFQQIEKPLGNTFTGLACSKEHSERYEFLGRKPDIVTLLSCFNITKSNKEFPLSFLNKDLLMPLDENVHKIYHDELMQHYISIITDN